MSSQVEPMSSRAELMRSRAELSMAAQGCPGLFKRIQIPLEIATFLDLALIANQKLMSSRAALMRSKAEELS